MNPDTVLANAAGALPHHASRISDVEVIQATGPFLSKSGGRLSVPVTLPLADAMRFLEHDACEPARMDADIRGLRVFFLHGNEAGKVAGNQYHRLRTEVAFVDTGSVHWEFEDLHGNRRELEATSRCAVRIPPFILHRVRFNQDSGTLVTLANTIYHRDDPRTHDTYPEVAFRDLQRAFQERSGVA